MDSQGHHVDLPKSESWRFSDELGNFAGNMGRCSQFRMGKALFQCWETLKDPLRLGFAGDFLFSN